MPEACTSNTPHHPEIHARAVTLLGIYLVNWFFTIITLGVYYFWGRIKIRKYLYGQIELDGSRFSFRGTGQELFVGFLKVLAASLPVVALFIIPGVPENAAVAVVYLFVLGLLPLALYGAKRYQMSRSCWRGIRFHFRGSIKEIYKIFLIGNLLNILTLGLYYPFYRVRMRRYWMNGSTFGLAAFRYYGKGKELFRPYLKCYLWSLLFLFLILTAVSVPGIGVKAFPKTGLIHPAMLLIPILFFIAFIGLNSVWFYWAAYEYRYHWNHTEFDGVPFQSDMRGWDIFNRRVAHFLVLVCTLGLGFIWTKIDILRLYFSKTAMTKLPDFAKIKRDAEVSQVKATGESLADFFDLGFDFGI